MALSLNIDLSSYGNVSSSFSYSGRTYSTYENGTKVTSYPDGTTYVRNADGSGMTVRADGSGYSYSADWSEYLSVNADGSSYQKFSDGSTLSIKADGGYSLRNKDGSSVTENADGSGYSRGADGSYAYKNADGSASYRYSDGSYVSVKADGSMSGGGGDYAYWKTNADGSMKYAYNKGWSRADLDSPPVDLPLQSVVISANSEAMQKLNQLKGVEEQSEPEIRYPIVETQDDGSEKSTEEDGSYSIKHLDGSLEKVDLEGVSVRTYDDGTVTTTQTDGSYSINHPDGSVETVDTAGVSVRTYDDGTEVTLQADGSYSTARADGSVEVGDGKGNSSRTWEDGSYVKKYDDKSVEKGDAEGNSVRTWEGGHYSKTYSDNSVEEGDGFGNSTRTYDNGEYTRHYTDGSVEKGDAEGNSLRTYEDGSYVQNFADSSVKEGDGQGNAVHTQPDGSYVKNYADRSVETSDGQGNSTRTWEDGAYRKQYDDNSVEQGDNNGNSQRTWDNGNYIRQYADNSTESGDAAGNYTLTQPDGSFARGYADGSTEVGDGKGNITRTYEDGRVETRFEDNSVQSTDADGNLTRTYENGSYTKEYQDGTIETGDGQGNSIHTQEDGSYSKQYSDGSVEQGDGQGNSTRSFDDGAYIKRYDDNSIEKGDGQGASTRTYDDGHYVQNFADGSVKEGDGQGNNTLTQKDGAYIKQFADTDAVETGDGQGTVTLTQASGHYVTNHTDGSVEKGDGQGHVLQTWEDGRFEEQFHDGSVKTGDGQGNSLHTFEDKHYIQTFDDNSVEKGDGFGNSLRTFDDNTYEQKRDDASVETGDDQGNSTRTWQNGKYETKRDDNSVENGDGQGNSLRQWDDGQYEQKRDDGSIETGDDKGNSTRTWEDGKYEQNREDDSEETGDGQGNSLRKWEDGKYEQKRDDSSVETGDGKGNSLRTHDDGQYSRTYVDKSSEEGDGNGNSTRTYDDGSYLKKSADGTQETGDGEGNLTRVFKDGTYEREYTDGSKETGDGQGNSIRTFEDESYIKNYDDKSVETGAADGTYYRDFGEGVYETKHADGSVEKGEGADTSSIYDDSSTRTYEDGTVTTKDGRNFETHHTDGSVEKGYENWKGLLNSTRTWEDGSYETKSTYYSKQGDAEGNVTTFRPRDGDEYSTQYVNGDRETGNVEDGSYSIRFAEGGSETGNKLDGTYTKKLDWRNYETKHADGSLETGDTYTGSSLRTFEDGSYTEVSSEHRYFSSAEDYKEQGQADGSYVRTYQNGTVDEHKADGSSVITFADGTVETTDAQGNYQKAWNDGSKETGTKGDAGTVVTSERIYNDGSVEFRNADGSYGETNGDGSYDHYSAEGEHYYKRLESDGGSFEVSSDGSITSVKADGSYYKSLADGGNEQGNADGSYNKKHADGTTEYGDGKGFSILRHPDGSSEKHYPTGAITHKDVDGNITYTGYTLTHDDGSTETGDGAGVYTREWETGAYIKDHGNGRVDQVEADGTGYSEFSITQFIEVPSTTGIGTSTTMKEVSFKADLNDLIGAGKGLPEAYTETTSGVIVEYAGEKYLAQEGFVDQSWKADYPDSENIERLFTEGNSNEVTVYFNDESPYDSVATDTDGNQHIDYADGIELDTPIGLDKGTPVSYKANGDQINVTYADGSGYTSEAENIDLSWREAFPEGMRSFTANSYNDKYTIHFPEESGIHLVTMSEDGAQFITYKENGYEGEKLGRQDEMPISYHRDGDNVRVTYADGSGYSTEVDNVNLDLLLGNYPEHDNITMLTGSGATYNDDSQFKRISVTDYDETHEGVDSVGVFYKDGSSERERYDGAYEFETADGIRYYTGADGTTKVTKSNEATGTLQSDTRYADGGFSITGGVESENQKYDAPDESSEADSIGRISSYDLSPDDYDSVLHDDNDPENDDMKGSLYQDGTYRYDLEDGTYAANDGERYTVANEDGRFIQNNYGGKTIYDDPAEFNLTYADLWSSNGVALDLKEGFLQMPELGVFITIDTKDEDGEELGYLAKLMSMVLEIKQCSTVSPNPADYSYADYPLGHGEMVENDDGSQTLLRDDGYQFTWFEDGHMQAVLPNDRGSQEFFPDAQGSEASYIFHYPDNEQWAEGAAYTRLADGSASYVDGEHKVNYPANGNEVNATTTFQQPDGSFGQSVVTRQGEEDESLVAEDHLAEDSPFLTDLNNTPTNSLKMVQLPGVEEPIVFGQSEFVATKDENGEVTNRSLNTEYNFYETNEDGSFDLLIGSNVRLDTPQDLAELIQPPSIEPEGFAWEKDIEAPEYLANNSFFGNDDLAESVNADLDERIQTAREQDNAEFVGRTETVNEDGSIDATYGAKWAQDSDWNQHTSADGDTQTTTSSHEWASSRGVEHEAHSTSVVKWENNEQGERVTAEQSTESIGYDEDGNLSLSLQYSAGGRTINYRYNEKYDTATINILEADGSSMEYRHSTDTGFFGGEIDYSSLSLRDAEGDAIYHRLGADNKTTYSSEEGTFTLEADGTIYSAFDDARVDTVLYQTEEGEILPAETGPYTLGDDGKIITDIDTEGKDVVGDVGDNVPREGDYYKPDYDDVDKVTDLVAEGMPEEFLDLMAVMGPPLMTQSLLDSGRVTEESMQTFRDEEAAMQDEVMENQGWGSLDEEPEVDSQQDEAVAPDPDPFAENTIGNGAGKSTTDLEMEGMKEVLSNSSESQNASETEESLPETPLEMMEEQEDDPAHQENSII